jgi:hypothetical protein
VFLAKGPYPATDLLSSGDDAPYLIKSCVGESTLMIGTDCG